MVYTPSPGWGRARLSTKPWGATRRRGRRSPVVPNQQFRGSLVRDEDAVGARARAEARARRRCGVDDA